MTAVPSSMPENSEVFVRVMFEDLSNDSIVSEAVQGYFRTAPVKSRAIRFLWGGDTAGQGWGINPDFGGMKIYEEKSTRPCARLNRIFSSTPVILSMPMARLKPR